MLWPYCCVINVAPKIAKTLNWGCISSRREANAWNEPFAEDLAAVRALNEPVLGTLIENGTIDVLVVCDVLLQFPLLLEMIEVSS